MALTRVVNGERVELSPQEETQIRAEWAQEEAAATALELANLKKKLAEIEAKKAIEAMISDKKVQIEGMNKDALEAAIAAGGL